MKFLLRYDHIDKVYRIKRAAIYVLWLLLLLLWVIPPTYDFDKMLVVALEDVSRVLFEVNPTLANIKEVMDEDEPHVESASRGPVEYETIYKFFRNDKQGISLSYFFFRGEFDGIQGFKSQYRRRGVPYALIRENCLNAVRDRFGTSLNNISRYEHRDEYRFPILGMDGSQRIVVISLYVHHIRGRRVWLGKLSVLFAPRERVLLSLSYGREWQERRGSQ